MAEPYEALGRRLLGIRSDLAAREGGEVSQRQMADRLVETWIEGVSATQTQVSRWETGKARPRKATLAAYARLAGGDEHLLLRLAGYGYIDEVAGAESGAESRRRTVRPSWRWLAVLAPIAVLFLAWAGYRATRPANPTEAWLGGGQLTVLAADDRLWSLGLPKGLRPRVEPLVRDLDGDGRNEILVSLDPAEPAQQTGRLVCFGHDGSRRWEVPYGRRLAIGERRFTPYFLAHHLAWLDTREGGYILVVARHERWFPAQVLLLDPRDGALAGEYWHPGYIETFATFDVDSDGTTELLLGGVNNPGDGPGRPALAVLDLPFRPAAGPDAVFGITHAAERAYLLFPRPDLHREVSELAAVTTLSSRQAEDVVAGVSTPGGNDLFYTLDSSLGVVDLRISDTFVHHHDRLLGHRYTPEERQSWRVLLRYARAPDANRLQEPTQREPTG